MVKVTILGIPNTGKSTLFNRIIGKRRALVHSSPGMTRDIIREKVCIDNRLIVIQDSGGYIPDESQLSRQINQRIFEEAKRSHLIIFLFDGKRELIPIEKDFFLQIKRIQKNIIPVINKADSLSNFFIPTSYYQLKEDFVFISAEHNQNIDQLLEEISRRLPSGELSSKTNQISPAPRISILGKPNVGKSSLINCFLHDDQLIVSSIPGTTRDSHDLEIQRNQKSYILVDNAGIRKIQKIKEGTECAAVIRAEKHIPYVDIIAFVIDLSRPLDQNDFFIAKKIVQSAKPVIIVGNKKDLLPNQENIQRVSSHIFRSFYQLYYAPFIAVSAKTGKNIYHFFDQIQDIQNRLQTKIKPKELNEKIQNILSKKKLKTIGQELFSPKYISIESYRPFFLIFHGRSVSRLLPENEVWLKKQVVSQFSLTGIPIFFKMSKTK